MVSIEDANADPGWPAPGDVFGAASGKSQGGIFYREASASIASALDAADALLRAGVSGANRCGTPGRTGEYRGSTVAQSDGSSLTEEIRRPLRRFHYRTHAIFAKRHDNHRSRGASEFREHAESRNRFRCDRGAACGLTRVPTEFPAVDQP